MNVRTLWLAAIAMGVAAIASAAWFSGRDVQLVLELENTGEARADGQLALARLSDDGGLFTRERWSFGLAPGMSVSYTTELGKGHHVARLWPDTEAMVNVVIDPRDCRAGALRVLIQLEGNELVGSDTTCSS